MARNVKLEWNENPILAHIATVVEQELLPSLAQQVAAEAKALAPVATGRLRNSIRILEIEREPGGRKIRVTIGTDVEYALHVELGVPKRQRPQPFLRPALDRLRIIGRLATKAK